MLGNITAEGGSTCQSFPGTEQSSPGSGAAGGARSQLPRTEAPLSRRDKTERGATFFFLLFPSD